MTFPAFIITVLLSMVYNMKGDRFLQKKRQGDISWMVSSLSREQQRSRHNDLGLNQGPPDVGYIQKDRGQGEVRVTQSTLES